VMSQLAVITDGLRWYALDLQVSGYLPAMARYQAESLRQFLFSLGDAALFLIPVPGTETLAAGKLTLLGRRGVSTGGARAGAGVSDEMVTVYRGVHAEHPQLANALRGRADPMGGHSSPLLHNQGDNASVFTSWTTNRSTAVNDFALSKGPGGVLLEQTVPRSSLIKSPDLLKEFEVLRQGPVSGASTTIFSR